MKTLAYQVKEELQGYATIVFAASEEQARNAGAHELDADLPDVVVERAGWADSYAPGPVPVKARLEQAGWWFDCACGCGLEVSIGAEHGGETAAPVYDGERVYWSAAHKDRLHGAVCGKDREQAVAAVALQFPFASLVEVVRTSDGGLLVGMTFPGATGQARWVVGSSEVDLDDRDLPAWQACAPGSEGLDQP